MLKPAHVIEDDESLAVAITALASAMADASRVKMLCALMDGRAWTATELATVAEVSASTASAHLSVVWSAPICWFVWRRDGIAITGWRVPMSPDCWRI